jgi:hypothetical protein
MKKFALVVGCFAACLIGSGSAALASPITYEVDVVVGGGSVVGTVATNGGLGALTPSDFIAWNLQLNGLNGATYVISSKDSNAVVWGKGSDVTATSSQLLYNFGGNGFLVFQDGKGSGRHYYCNSAVNGACYQGISIVPNGYNDGTQDIVAMTGNDVFATAVPELSTWAYMLFGFVGLGSLAWRRRLLDA